MQMMHIRRPLNTIRSFPARYLLTLADTPANLSDMIENKYTFNKAHTFRTIIKPSLKGAPRVVRRNKGIPVPRRRLSIRRLSQPLLIEELAGTSNRLLVG